MLFQEGPHLLGASIIHRNTQQDLVVAIGVDAFGDKKVLGVQPGATENCEVVSGLLSDLQGWGLDFDQPRLYVIDGNAASRRALEKFAGAAAFVQPLFPACYGACCPQPRWLTRK